MGGNGAGVKGREVKRKEVSGLGTSCLRKMENTSQDEPSCCSSFFLCFGNQSVHPTTLLCIKLGVLVLSVVACVFLFLSTSFSSPPSLAIIELTPP